MVGFAVSGLTADEDDVEAVGDQEGGVMVRSPDYTVQAATQTVQPQFSAWVLSASSCFITFCC